MDVVDVLAGDVRELGDQRAGQRTAAGVLDAAEVAAGHVEQGEVGARARVPRVVDDQVEEHEEREDGDAGEEPGRC
jgi:hypothetical protein